MVRRNINVASRPPFKGNEERLEPSGFEPFDVGAITDERPPTAVEGVVMFKPTSGRGKLGGPRNPHQKVSQIQRFEPKGDGRLSSVSRRWNPSHQRWTRKKNWSWPSWPTQLRWITPRTRFRVRWGLRLQAGNKTSKQILIRRVVVRSESIAYEMT